MKLFQLKIELAGSRPKIWRRFIVSSDNLLSDLHKIIQSVMGWSNSHLHQFIKDETFYSVRMKDDTFWDDSNNVDYKKLKISDLIQKEQDQVEYEYDFGDSWIHNIILEKVLKAETQTVYPVCIAGKMNCPPEDCGGIWGYANILKILKKTDHPEYLSLSEWLGEEFDPQYFSTDEINQRLKRRNFGL